MEDATLLLLIAASIGGACLGTIGYNLYNPKRLKEFDSLDKDLKDYDSMLEKIASERNQIREAMSNIPRVASTQQSEIFNIELAALVEQLSISNIPRVAPTQQSSNCHQFFSSLIQYKRVREETKALFSEYHELVHSYPIYRDARARKEPGYVKEIRIEMEEHHAKVMMVAEEIFKRVDNARYQQEKKSAVISF